MNPTGTARLAPPADATAGRAVRRAVTEVTRERCVAALDGSLRAIVLTGSLARDEASFLSATDGRTRLLGDAEFLLVHRDDRHPDDRATARLAGEVEQALSGRGVQGHITLTACQSPFLRALPAHIFAYELRACGEVVWGDPNVLSLIPAFERSQLAQEDAWRLLCNRLVEQLEARAAAGARAEAMPRELHYHTIKLYLDLATSLLVFAGEFEAGYRARAARLSALAAREGSVAGFPASDLAAKVEACTRWKLMPDDGVGDWQFREEAMRVAHALWRWELAVLTGLPADTPDDVLLSAWMARQPLRRRLRGWAHVARGQGWLRGWQDRARWPRLAWKASPRYWVYAAATRALFDGDGAAESGAWHEVRRTLPVWAPAAGTAPASPWHRLARDVAWNYNQFLVHTRS